MGDGWWVMGDWWLVMGDGGWVGAALYLICNFKFELKARSSNLWVEKGRPTLAFPSFRLIVCILNSNVVSGGGDLNCITWNAALTLVVTIWWPWPKCAQPSVCCPIPISWCSSALKSLQNAQKIRQTLMCTIKQNHWAKYWECSPVLSEIQLLGILEIALLDHTWKISQSAVKAVVWKSKGDREESIKSIKHFGS